jgi:hypothetical protein
VEIKKGRTGEIFLVKREEVISKIQEMTTEEMMAHKRNPNLSWINDKSLSVNSVARAKPARDNAFSLADLSSVILR